MLNISVYSPPSLGYSKQKKDKILSEIQLLASLFMEKWSKVQLVSLIKLNALCLDFQLALTPHTG